MYIYIYIHIYTLLTTTEAKHKLLEQPTLESRPLSRLGIEAKSKQ